MIKNEQASLSVTKIAIITIITIFALSIGVLASSIEVRNVKIVLSDNCEIEVFTTKTVVADILEENHIVILPEEHVVPNLDSEILDNSSKIVITGTTQDISAVAAVAKESEKIHLDQLLSTYNTITEKIETVEEEIPYETVIKDGSKSSVSNTTKVLQEGQEGIKRTTYKVKYQDDIEIEREVLKEEIIQEPINKIIETTNVSSRSSNVTEREKAKETIAPINTTNKSSLAAKVEGITPTKKTLNTSAYTAADCGKSHDTAYTASGAKATAWYTVAAGKGYAIGTIIYIPYFEDKPNGGWFVVQDRGGSISNNKLDVYMSTSKECIQFGRRNLECYIYEI